MNRDQQIALIRQKCIEANPEIEKIYDNWASTHDRDGEQYTKVRRLIHLADVLLAIEKSGIGVRPNGMFVKIGGFREPNVNYTLAWNLRRDDLTDQSDECITFLTKLLQ